jgi:hypothetical protein
MRNTCAICHARKGTTQVMEAGLSRSAVSIRKAVNYLCTFAGLLKVRKDSIVLQGIAVLVGKDVFRRPRLVL